MATEYRQRPGMGDHFDDEVSVLTWLFRVVTPDDRLPILRQHVFDRWWVGGKREKFMGPENVRNTLVIFNIAIEVVLTGVGFVNFNPPLYILVLYIISMNWQKAKKI